MEFARQVFVDAKIPDRIKLVFTDYPGDDEWPYPKRAEDLGEREAETMILSQYDINAFWGPRPETPEGLAIRFVRLTSLLGRVDPSFGNWIWCGGQPEPILFDVVRTSLATKISESVARGDDGEPEPVYGYGFGILNSLTTTPRSLSLRIHAGSQAKASFYSNTAYIGTARKMAPDPAIVAYPIFKAALLALCECFDVTFCNAYPKDVMNIWPVNQKFRLGWMTYVSPRFAPLVTPPKSAIVEYCPSGALFMAATDETFVTANPKHLAVARDIEAAIAPLNALPWPLDAEPQ
jgi:immunity protein 52 of polymorphic toxin system